MGFKLLPDVFFVELLWYRRIYLIFQQLLSFWATSWRTEENRWYLWIAPFVGGGVGAYFALPMEPPVWVGGAGSLFVLLAALSNRIRNGGWVPALVFAGAILAGFTAGQIRTWSVAAPVLHKSLGPLYISGTVEDIEETGSRWRMVLGDLDVSALRPGKSPVRIRVSLGTSGGGFIPGSRIRALVKLRPPPGPVIPGGNDFARRAWFEEIGAVGFVLGTPVLLHPPVASLWQKGRRWVKSLRLKIAERFKETLGETAGGVAAALAVGVRGAIPSAVVRAYRAAGLAHLLAISGLHMGLAAGLFFVVVRAAVALIPSLALRVDGKKRAAIAALGGVTVYLVLSGASVTALRAHIMVSIAFLAILVDRSALSLRTLSVAAILLLLLRPEIFIGASFQMSFAAVTALISVYEGISPGLSTFKALSRRHTWVRRLAYRFALYGGGIILTTFIASTATLPFVSYHFHKVALYGVAANLAVMPVVSLWIMPFLILSVLAMPFGGDGLFAPILGTGIHLIEIIAKYTASLPSASVHTPPLPTPALIALSVAALWVALWRTRWRWGGVVVIVFCCVVPWTSHPPTLLVSADGYLVGVWRRHGLWMSPGRGQGFTRSVWTEWWTTSDDNPLGSFPTVRCDSLGCLVQGDTDGDALSWVFHPAALAEDCPRVRVLITPLFRRTPPCEGLSIYIDGSQLRKSGAQALWISHNGILERRETVANRRGNRPWTRPRP